MIFFAFHHACWEKFEASFAQTGGCNEEGQRDEEVGGFLAQK